MYIWCLDIEQVFHFVKQHLEPTPALPLYYAKGGPKASYNMR